MVVCFPASFSTFPLIFGTEKASTPRTNQCCILEQLVLWGRAGLPASKRMAKYLISRRPGKPVVENPSSSHAHACAEIQPHAATCLLPVALVEKKQEIQQYAIPSSLPGALSARPPRAKAFRRTSTNIWKHMRSHVCHNFGLQVSSDVHVAIFACSPEHASAVFELYFKMR